MGSNGVFAATVDDQLVDRAAGPASRFIACVNTRSGLGHQPPLVNI
jgi:hypothetical protein